MAFFTALFTVLGEHIATLIACVLGLGVAYIILSPRGRLIIKGIRNYLTSNATNNPRIAAGIFDEKINELRDKKKKAVELSEKAHGALVEACENEQSAKREFHDCSKKAKRLEERGDHEHALLLARQAQSAMTRADRYTQKIPDLKAMADATQQRVKEIDLKIAEMEERKTTAIENIKKGKLEKEISEELLELNISEIDASIKGIEEHSNESKYIGVGARVAYENSDKKRVQDALDSANYGDAEDFLRQLMESND